MASQEISSKNKILSGIIGFGILFLIVEVVYYSWTIPFKYEAVNQKAYKEDKSAGDCRFVNSKFAYEHNMGFELHKFNEINPETNKAIEVYHLYAVDENKRIYDVSNGSNIEGITYEEFLKKENVISDELLISGKMSKDNYNYDMHTYTNIMAITGMIALEIYYDTYKLN